MCTPSYTLYRISHFNDHLAHKMSTLKMWFVGKNFSGLAWTAGVWKFEEHDTFVDDML